MVRPAVIMASVLSLAACTVFHVAVRPPGAVSIDCATAGVVGLRWSAASSGKKAVAYGIARDGRPIGTTADLRFADTVVSASASYAYTVSAIDSAGNAAAADPLNVTTPAAAANGDAPYCQSRSIPSMAWDWAHGYRAADGSDLWPVTWGRDGNVYAFFGDGGGFGGDDHRGRTSFGIAMITGRPPLSAADEVNIYGGYLALHPSRLSGKASSLIAVGADFYAIAGIYRSGDPKFRQPPPISGAPEHVEIVYSRHDASSWRESGWTFCDPGAPAAAMDTFCPSGFVNHGRAGDGARDRYVYLLGTSPAADGRRQTEQPAARTYLSRVPRSRILIQAAYRYFAGLDSRSRPVWSGDPWRMQPVFTDRNAPQPGCGGHCGMSVSLEEAVYVAPLRRYIGVAQGDYLAQTSFYEAANLWGPWATISYQNINAADGSGGWGNLGSAAGGSLGVHIVNAWTGTDGRSLWMAYSSDGVAPAGAFFPPPGSKLDAFHLVRADLQVVPPQ
jgi:hypothetical protein